MPFQSVVCAYLATERQDLRERIQRAISRGTYNARNSEAYNQLLSFLKSKQASRGNFTLEPWNATLAKVLVGAHRVGVVYSEKSLMETFALEITKTNVNYHQVWNGPQISGKTDYFVLKPVKMEMLRKSLRSQLPATLTVVVQSDIVFRIQLHGTYIKSCNQEERSKFPFNSRPSRFTIIDPISHPAQSAHYVFAEGVSEHFQEANNVLSIRISSPAQILQVSAAAEQGRWILYETESYSVAFPVPHLDDAGPHSHVWVSDWIAHSDYLRGNAFPSLYVSSAIAKECLTEFSWCIPPYASDLVISTIRDEIKGQTS